jgi:hypothetical protein
MDQMRKVATIASFGARSGAGRMTALVTGAECARPSWRATAQHRRAYMFTMPTIQHPETACRLTPIRLLFFAAGAPKEVPLGDKERKEPPRTGATPII